ncbi:MAG: PSD1 and planctomycete cytochrome C domain-containing protein [Planctomycetota bacterium]
MNPRSTPLLLFAFTSALNLLAASCFAEIEEEFFESHIRPLLVEHCLDCHGSKKQEGALRLDSREAWMRGGDRGAAIVAGKDSESLLMHVVEYQEPDLQMPPDRKLSASEISALRTWIKQGAFDPRQEGENQSSTRMDLEDARTFWSLEPLRSPEVPDAIESDWVRNPIDAFVLSRLQQHDLTPVDDADRETLLRRATFDLTGLPPTPEQSKRFISDDSPQAFQALVDRLLDSEAYGERWGRHWLDVSRYADTAGDGSDYPVREAYKYRDWVIRAFNEDMPFDQFVREQIAGDILAKRDSMHDLERYASQVTATGFLAIGKRYGYRASPDYQYLDFADVIDSIGRSLQGLTLGCARCHDHKYDPISAEDYYALYGILESTQWAFPGGEEQKRPAHFPPLVPPKQAIAQEKARTEKIAEFDAELAKGRTQLAQLDSNWIAGGVDLGFEKQKPGSPPSAPWVSSGPIEIRADAQSPFDHVHPKGKLGIRIGSGLPTDGLRYVFEKGLNAKSAKKMHFSVDFRSVTSAEQGAFRFYLGRGVVQSLAVQCSATANEFAIFNGNKWETIRKIQPGTWCTLQIAIDTESRTYSGTVGTSDDLTSFSGKSVGLGWDGVVDCFICDGFGHVSGPACSRDLDNLGLQEAAFHLPGTASIAPRKLTEEQKKEFDSVSQRIEELQRKRDVLAAGPAYEVAYGVSEGTPVNAQVQIRGEPHRKGEQVQRRFLEALGGEVVAPNSLGSGRLELANWIASPDNPLTARVFVNRVWQWHFGRGLVDTPSDFGSRGARPSHPQLLDWLASEFIRSGWSVKHLHQLIMSSRTWQLASDNDIENHQSDPSNRWHWRYSRRQLDAESIRDAMLFVSGNLEREPSGEHPFPDVSTWGYTIHNPFHAVYDSNHRSVYLMVQRNRRHPYLALFDAADPNQSVALRNPTTTPTQALYLMNSPFVHAQAESFAARILGVSGDASARVAWAFALAHGKVPANSVLQDSIAFIADYQARAEGSEQEKEQSAWSALARVLLTSNDFLFLD